MMIEDQFLKLCKQNGYDEKVFFTFKNALSLSKKHLSDKKRLSGDSFYDHCVRVAIILTENKVAPEVILAGILHGILKYCPAEEIKENFGEEVLKLVKGVEDIKHIKSKNKQLETDALRKIILTTLRDVRVIFVKLADKLDNLSTIEVLPVKEQKRIAEEVLEVYAPLANNVGLEKIKISLEDLSLQILNIKKYQEIVNFLERSREQREKDITYIIEQIKKITENKVLLIKIKGRPKHVYSIFKKITTRNVQLSQQYDLLGIRIIVPEVKDCYTLLGLLHEKFEPTEGRLKDYIANPKPNLYRSIHTCLKLPGNKIVEVQIRTPEMDDFAEGGLAAHWRYKGIKSDFFFEKKIGWLKGILDLQKEGSKEFLEAAKVDVFGDKIYCYTPKGDVKELPKDASLLDFAYLVHEEIGSKAVGGRVNGKFVPLRHQLVQGDVIEIITNKNQRPRRAWIKIVKSARAKQKIRKSLRKHEKIISLHYHLFKPAIKEEQGILVESEEFPKAICLLAKCCNPLPGEEIAGIITKRKIISVHNVECRHALKEESRWVGVNWKETFNQKIKFYIKAEERSGLLADLLNTIANAGFEVKEAKAKLIDIGNAECSFIVIPKDLDHLKELVKRVKKVISVQKIYFE
ncbi:MAG: HD domain-containing protein [Nanoarchaeota archaeon]|nr:HD domain-containing protein [Nanoarchaeota archaeon]MBU1632623.1 HD domain-containing protein [Nanoarchaeota archaeon]MBU1876554.1 HD domain-containing protein [Nanoarchaeota archaeon]